MRKLDFDPGSRLYISVQTPYGQIPQVLTH
jgi:hypothetical protein